MGNIGLALVAATVAGCEMLSPISPDESMRRDREEAHDHFVRDHSCPDHRLVLAVRPDLHFVVPPQPPPPDTPEYRELVRKLETPWRPPEDVAADPERLAVWQQHHPTARERERRDDRPRVAPAFVSADGCGAHVIYYCHAQWAHPWEADCELPQAPIEGNDHAVVVGAP